MKKTKIIFELNSEIITKIDEIATRKGYKTRNAFLRDLLWNYVLEEATKDIKLANDND